MKEEEREKKKRVGGTKGGRVWREGMKEEDEEQEEERERDYGGG